MSPPDVLLAIRPQDVEMTVGGLGNEFKLQICHTLHDAKVHLHPDVGLISCGVHFDSGAMFDLLEYVKADARYRHIPFYLFLGEGSQHSEAVLHGIRAAARLKGAAGFTDMSRVRRDLGDAEAFARMRASIRAVLAQRRGTSA